MNSFDLFTLIILYQSLSHIYAPVKTHKHLSNCLKAHFPISIMTSKCKAYDVRITLAQHEQASWLPLMKALVSSEQALITRFLIGGPEIGIKEGRRHVHVYVEFLNQTTVTSMKKKLRLEGLIHWHQNASKNDYDRIRKHHTKELSKEDPGVLSLLEYPTYTTLEVAPDGGVTSNKGKITDQIQQIIEQGGSLEDVKNASYGFYASHSGFVEKELLSTGSQRLLSSVIIFGSMVNRVLARAAPATCYSPVHTGKMSTTPSLKDTTMKMWSSSMTWTMTPSVTTGLPS